MNPQIMAHHASDAITADDAGTSSSKPEPEPEEVLLSSPFFASLRLLPATNCPAKHQTKLCLVRVYSYVIRIVMQHSDKPQLPSCARKKDN